MYKYDQYDQKLVDERVEQYRDQTQRYLAGEISEEQFLPLRLQNGLYVQRLAPMLRIAVPYGLLSSKQVRKLAHISRRYDKGYVHFTTRQNIQLNWPQLEEVPDILAELASVEMHAIQTSGNCIRNTTTDQFAGVANDEIEDPRPWCEIIRQWSTLHPEFAFLPRKFKIAVCGSEEDRAAFLLHDIGLQLVVNDQGETGFQVYVGGGLGRTPVIASLIREFLPKEHLLTYLDAILRVYNRYGNRDNKYKARIKILVRAWTPEVFAQRVESEWAHLKDGPATLNGSEIERVKGFFTLPDYRSIDQTSVDSQVAALAADNRAFSRWLDRNVRAQKQPGYASVSLSLKPAGVAPGDVTDQQLEIIADLADRFSFGEIRSTHNQNVVLADVAKDELFELWQLAKAAGLATPNIGTINDMICCPGGDYCSLANAKSIPVAEAIQRKFDDLDYVYDLGNLELNISGCMNACGHHHIGHIGILGVDKKGEEWYQIQLGGSANKDAALGKVLGPSLSRDAVTDSIEKLLDVYVENRLEGEAFLGTYQRIGIEKFKQRVYGTAS
ncbi:nitrite/sulfite reductase [SAR92 clade bacterium H231]|jgi:sulfite reductase (NADPH) hemoprotein beta-component|nr:nitrite/sulfite reductase [Porticoccaceae bacterium]MCT2532343.1 nitrite/sulfite reductase [SAR92 clade bacterium H231]MBT7904679.1 nitrite/sulfite reductase [Porticoccaceae bacterium]MDB2480961.1 nitrite/sulfite reductase [Porticoccaceae bacterium]MDG1199012.1 nitrite/sulfite reductase [Porticoccaceae bacterium]